MKRLHTYLKDFFFENVTAIVDFHNHNQPQSTEKNNIQIRPIQLKKTLKSVDFIIISFFLLMSSIQMIFLTKLENMGLWTISFLVNNLIINSAVLILRYFPYQIINYSNKTRQNMTLLTRITNHSSEDIPLVRQQNNANCNSFGELRLVILISTG